jgi:hypothetical protein
MMALAVDPVLHGAAERLLDHVPMPVSVSGVMLEV